MRALVAVMPVIFACQHPEVVSQDDQELSVPDEQDVVSDETDTVSDDQDGDGLSAEDDCDDNDPSRGGEEVWYPDVDGDGLGDDRIGIYDCEAPGPDWVQEGGDCDDNDETVTQFWWYPDADADGWGDASDPGVSACSPQAGELLVENNLDCDDGNAGVHPEAEEVPWDGVDSDCDGQDTGYTINTDGLTDAACPAWFPADQPDAGASLYGYTGTSSSYALSTSMGESGVYSGMNVWFVRLQGAGDEASTDTTLAVTCEEDGVHLVYENRTTTTEAGDASTTFTEFSSRPLFFTAAPVYAEDWVVPDVELDTDPAAGWGYAPGAESTVIGMRNEVTVSFEGEEVTAQRFIFSDADGDWGVWYLLDGIGPVHWSKSGEIELDATGR